MNADDDGNLEIGNYFKTKNVLSAEADQMVPASFRTAHTSEMAVSGRQRDT